MWTIDRIDGLLNLATIEEEAQAISDIKLNICDWPIADWINESVPLSLSLDWYEDNFKGRRY